MKSILLSFCLLMSGIIHSQELLMVISDHEINGNQVTFNVSAENFTDMISTQYSIAYDPDKLVFNSIININLPTLSEGAFGTNVDGFVVHAWFDPSLDGQSMDPGAVIYQLRFDMLGTEIGDVCFSMVPLHPEFAKVQETLLSFNVIDYCHPEPFPFMTGSTGVNDLTKFNHLKVNSTMHANAITFSLDVEENVEFQLLNLNGSHITTYPSANYPNGTHSLRVVNSVVPGMYLLASKIGDEVKMHKVIR